MLEFNLVHRPPSASDIDNEIRRIKEKLIDCRFVLVIGTVAFIALLGVTTIFLRLDAWEASLQYRYIAITIEIAGYSVMVFYVSKQKRRHRVSLERFDNIGPAHVFEIEAWAGQYTEIKRYKTRLAVRDRQMTIGEYEMIQDWVSKRTISTAINNGAGSIVFQ